MHTELNHIIFSRKALPKAGYNYQELDDSLVIWKAAATHGIPAISRLD